MKKTSIPSAVASPSVTPAASASLPPAVALPQVMLFGGASIAETVAAAQAALAAATSLPAPRALPGLDVPCRLAFVARDLVDARARVEAASQRKPRALAAQGIFLASEAPQGPPNKVAFLFPGQGSQYLGMLQDLAAVYPVVAATFAEADAVLEPLVGSRLTDIVWASNDEAHDARLRETQNCQPAMLTADVALLRLLAEHGVRPDMVAGHSLGEYAAAVAAEIMSFADALYAVSARGREMAGVKVEDPGQMAMVAAPEARVQAVLARCPGYIIAANKNCHTQTVIAGETEAVTAAIALFAEDGIEARQIPVSHAFHCRIVAPAAAPLAQVLRGLKPRAPRLPILSNVHADYYPDDPEAIVALLARQLAAPVEFIGQVERLYADGARIFVEVGPKRAITGFVRNILGHRPHRALAANHPKKPGVDGFLELLAGLASEGVGIVPSGAVVADARAAAASSTAAPAAVDEVGKAAAASKAGEAVLISGLGVLLPTSTPLMELGAEPAADLMAGTNYIKSLSDESRAAILQRRVVHLNKNTGAFTALTALSEVIQVAAYMGKVDIAAEFGIESSLADALDTTGRLAVASGLEALRDAGLPLVRRYRTTSTGSRLADRWALPPAVAARTGVIFASAFPCLDHILEDTARYAAAQAAGKSNQALRDFFAAWQEPLRATPLAAAMQRDLEARLETLQDEANLYQFQRKWLFRTLSLGHAQVAQIIGATGPNTQINAACASGTQAIAIAGDWVRQGRCDRVLVLTADNATAPHSLPWLGAGFLASGAASTEAKVERAAVPFGVERNGMILGAGAAAFVVESESSVRARGMLARAELVAADFANSAFHGTRLNGPFICTFMQGVVDRVATAAGTDAASLASQLFFMSHETYTPARGGSSAAEVEALRHSFGAQVGQVLIANTKGYTGHPMGATLEDAMAILGLQHQTLPAVANLREVDPAFADLRFAKGGAIEATYAIRFAAGFGSQVAMAAYRQRAVGSARLADPELYMSWLALQTGRADARLELVHRTLRVAEAGGSLPGELGLPALVAVATASPSAQSPALRQRPASAPLPAAPASELGQPPASSLPLAPASYLPAITAIFAEATGYPPEDLAPDHQLEADLGIDTVKQAEILALLRQRFGLTAAQPMRLSELQTLQQIAIYLASASAPAAIPTSVAAPSVAPVSVASPSIAPVPAASPLASPAPEDPLLAQLTAVFAEQTGYDLSDLQPEHQLEADLGIDTVKQAEIFALLRQRYEMPTEASFRLSDVQTLAALTAYVRRSAPAAMLAAISDPPPPSPGVGAGAAPATALPSRETLLAEVRQVFADATGYQVDELDAEHHLESDLGVDTVKQAEILAQLRQRFALRADASFSLASVANLSAITDYLLQQLAQAAPAAPVAPVASAALAVKSAGVPAASVLAPALHSGAVPVAPERASTQAAAAAPLARDEASILVDIRGLFAEQTGYDVEDLLPEAHLEADLGIDTVKQAEVLSLLRQRYGLAKELPLQLAELSSLAAIARLLADLPPPGRVAVAAVATASLAAAVPPSPSPVAVAARPDASPVAVAPFTVMAVGPVPLPMQVDEAWSLVDQQIVLIAPELAARAAMRAALTARGARVSIWEAADGAALTQRLADLGGRPADAVVCLLSDAVDMDARAVQDELDSVFQAARALARARANLAATGFLVVGRQGGAFGCSGDLSRGLLLGGASGLMKALAKEWYGANCLAVDLNEEVDWATGAARAVAAWQQPGPAERLWQQGRWWTLASVPALPAPSSRLPPGATVVATGGARGVTYSLLQALAEGRHLRIYVLARTGGVAPADSPLHGCDAATQRERARAALAARGERTTPAAIRRWVDRESDRITIHDNLEALRRAGADVTFIACDLQQPQALAAAAQQIVAAGGGVDLLLHGAGIEESRRLADKDAEAFARTFAPKVSAAWQLWETLKPRRTVAMGSVAGRFGNATQVDYAAANEALAAMARCPERRMLTIDWTAWGDVGMATRGSVRQVLEAAGVEMLPAAAGVRIGLALMQETRTGDVVVAGALGSFAPMHRPQGGSERPWPGLFDQVAVVDGHLQLQRRLDPSTDLGLGDHRIDGVPVLPGVLGVEMLVQAAILALRRPVTALHQVRFLAPVKLFRDAPLDITVAALPTPTGLSLVLSSRFAGPGGRVLVREHFRAEVPNTIAPGLPALAPALEMPCDPGIDRQAIYARYFHGPSFQVVQKLSRLGDNGADVVPTPLPPAWLRGLPQADCLTAPMWREAGFQAAGLWEMVELGRMALPAGIDVLELGPPCDGPVQVEARRRSVEAQGSVFDVWVRGADGRVHDMMRGYRTIILRDLTDAERFEPVRPRAPAPDWLSVPLQEIEPLLHDQAARDHYLSPAEGGRFAELKVAKRRLEWLAVRIAAKRLLRESFFGAEAAIVPYHAISIGNDPLGAPVVTVMGNSAPPPRLSLSHSAGQAVAYLAPGPEWRPGVDIEAIEARDPSFAATYFTADEQALAAADPAPDACLTAIWAVKEAMLKALGIGARVDLRELQVQRQEGIWSVELVGDALARAQSLRAGPARVTLEQTLTWVMARVLLPVPSSASPAAGATTEVRA